MANTWGCEQTNEYIGICLASARKRAGVTQEAVAKKCGMTKNHLSKVERNQSKASVELLLAYCETSEMSPNEVLGYKCDGISADLATFLSKMDWREQESVLDLLKKRKGDSLRIIPELYDALLSLDDDNQKRLLSALRNLSVID